MLGAVGENSAFPLLLWLGLHHMNGLPVERARPNTVTGCLFRISGELSICINQRLIC